MADPLALAPDPNAPKKPQQPGQAGGAPLTLAQPAIPSPTVAAPNAPVDRLQLATSNFDNLAKSSAPAYQASLDAANRVAYGNGQGMSGQLRTSIGDLALARARDLDTQRADLVNKATEGSIADASTAFQQGLAGAQQGLATQLGTGNLSIAQQQADTAKTGTLGSLGVQQGQLDLAKTGQAASIDQSQQQIDLARKTADINAQFQAGTLTVAQKDQALRELTAANQNTIATGQLDLAKTGQAADIADRQAQLDLATKSLAQSGIQFNAQLAEQQAARAQQGAQFDKSQALSADQFKQSLTQNAEQFNLSQTQATALAKLHDATENRQIDVSQAQGQNQLLVQLAAIIGGPTGNLNPTVLAAIAKQFGIIIPSPNNDTSLTGQTNTGGDHSTGDGSGVGTGKNGTGLNGGPA